MIGLLGNLSKDVLPGRPPHVGGGPYHGARALRRLRVPARIVARCAVADKESLLPQLVRLGTPVRYVPGVSTPAFAFTYDGDRRTMSMDAIGDTWLPADVPELRSPGTSFRRRPWPRSRGGAGSHSTDKGWCECPRSVPSGSTRTSIPTSCGTSGR